MKPRSRVYVFILENDQVAKALIRGHFTSEGITYAAVFKEETRQAIISALDAIQEN
jgi:hypothetical protein